MKEVIVFLIGVFFLSCSAPQLRQKDIGAEFTVENILPRSLYIAPVINMTMEKDLDNIDLILENSLSSKRKYFHWVGVQNSIQIVTEAGVLKDLDECQKQYSKEKNVDRDLVRRLLPALNENYIVFAFIDAYGEKDDSKMDKKFHKKKVKTTYTESYYSYLEGGFTVYDLKSGLAVFNARHSVDYEEESSTQREDKISTGDSKDMAGDCIGSCVADMATMLISGLITSIIVPTPDEMAGKLFDEIGENLPEKK